MTGKKTIKMRSVRFWENAEARSDLLTDWIRGLKVKGPCKVPSVAHGEDTLPFAVGGRLWRDWGWRES